MSGRTVKTAVFGDIDIIEDPSLPPNTFRLVDVGRGPDESVIQTFVPPRRGRPWPPFGGGLSKEDGTLIRAGINGFHELAGEWLRLSKDERDVLLDYAKQLGVK